MDTFLQVLEVALLYQYWRTKMVMFQVLAIIELHWVQTKLSELCLLEIYGSYLYLSELQFGFKEKK